MSDQLDVYVPPPAPVQSARRLLADAFRRQGTREVYATSIGKKVSYKDWLAIMLWDMITEGHATFLNGTVLVLEDYSDWLSTVKYLSSHMEGGASNDAGVNVNVYKVYAGIDPADV